MQARVRSVVGLREAAFDGSFDMVQAHGVDPESPARGGGGRRVVRRQVRAFSACHRTVSPSTSVVVGRAIRRLRSSPALANMPAAMGSSKLTKNPAIASPI